MQFADRCAPWKIANGAENLDLQVLQFHGLLYQSWTIDDECGASARTEQKTPPPSCYGWLPTNDPGIVDVITGRCHGDTLFTGRMFLLHLFWL
jgi:hypothetical protein